MGEPTPATFDSNYIISANTQPENKINDVNWIYPVPQFKARTTTAVQLFSQSRRPKCTRTLTWPQLQRRSFTSTTTSKSAASLASRIPR